MFEAYAALLVGVVCGAAAVAALKASRALAPLPYAAVHLTASLLMIALISLGYDSIPPPDRYPHLALSRLLYLGVSWSAFVATMWTYHVMMRPHLTLD